MLIASIGFCGVVDELGGKPFSDPAITQSMDEAWREKKINYAPENNDADLVVTLNQQFFEFMIPYIEQYGRDNNLKIKITKGTCGISAGMLAKKQGDIGALCCPPAKTDRLPGLKYHTIGVHPVSILVNPGNPIDNLSFAQVRQIFQGEIVRWGEVGGEDLLIQVLARLHCKKRPGHWRLLLDNEDLFSPETRTIGAIEDMFSLLAATPNAIGYEVMWMSHRNKGKVKSINIDGMGPMDLAPLLAGKYPLYRVLNITTWEDRHLQKPHSKRLVDFIIRQTELQGRPQGIIPVAQLREAGWKFEGSELVGEPDGK
ncbi:MAG: substrate-binding domain-containing protein [Thermodesulfobacteriota bacterium]